MRGFVGRRAVSVAAHLFGAAILIGTLAVVASPAPAGAADVVLTSGLLHAQDFPVPGEPDIIFVSVDNASATVATNVVDSVAVPPGGTVVDLSDNCTASGSNVTCTWPTVVQNSPQGARVYVTFDSTGTKTFTSSVTSDESTVDNSPAQLDVDVVNENADLAGTDDSARVVAGTQSTYRVSHQFTNKGPTAAADATVSGSVTGGGATIVPGSFSFFADYFNHPVDLAASDCTVTATTFSCTPVFSGGVFYAPQPFVNYDVMLPSTPATVVASATLTGRADPVSSNNTSTTTIQVAEPAAEIYAQIASPGDVVASGQPFILSDPIQSVGEIAAQQLVATLTVPDDWGVELSPNPPPSGVTCTVLTARHGLQCTRDSLAPGDSWDVQAQLTPPTGNDTATVNFDVTTTTPEIGTYPDSASLAIRYAPNGDARTLTATPAGLVDGDTVTLSGTGWAPNQEVLFCEIWPGPPLTCSGNITSTTTDSSGAFSIPLPVARFVVVPNVGVIDCAQPGTTCEYGAQQLTGAGPLFAPLSFAPQPPLETRISGHVADSAGNPVAGVRVWGYQASDTWVGTLQTVTDASGNYVLDNALPLIPYRVVFGPPSGSGLVLQWYNGTPAGVPSRGSASDVKLTPQAPTATVDALLAAGGTVSGTVTGPGGVPVAGAVVWGYRDTDAWVGSYATATDANGSYHIDGVAPGVPLRVLFAPPAGSGLAAEWFDNVGTRGAANPVTVDAGGTSTASASLTAQP